MAKLYAHTVFKTIAHPHKKGVSCVPCSSHHLFLVREGIQCGNCGALVMESVPDKIVYTDGSEEPFYAEKKQ